MSAIGPSSPIARLIVADVLAGSGLKASELAARHRVTQKHASKVLTMLGKLGIIGTVRCADGHRWYRADDVERIRKQVQRDAKRARAERNIMYMIEWRAKKSEARAQ